MSVCEIIFQSLTSEMLLSLNSSVFVGLKLFLSCANLETLGVAEVFLFVSRFVFHERLLMVDWKGLGKVSETFSSSLSSGLRSTFERGVPRRLLVVPLNLENTYLRDEILASFAARSNVDSD